MRLVANHFHRVEQRNVALIVICRIGVELDAVALNRNLRERRLLGLTEHTGEQIKVVLYIMVLVVENRLNVLCIIFLHPFAAVGIITLMTTGGTNEVERTVIRAERTALLAGHVLVAVNCYFLYIANGAQYRCAVVRINRTNNLIGVVVSLQSDINLASLEGRQHTFAEQRRLFVGRVIRTGEQVEVCQ